MTTNAGIEETIEGQVYEFTALEWNDYEWLELKLRARAIEAGRMSLPDDATADQRHEMMLPIIEAANNIEIFDSMDRLLSPLGISWIIYRLLVKKQPKIDRAMIWRWVRNPDLLNPIMGKILQLTGLQSQIKKGATTKLNPVRKRKS